MSEVTCTLQKAVRVNMLAARPPPFSLGACSALWLSCYASRSAQQFTRSLLHLWLHWCWRTQDMACDTFLKICNKCRRKFVVLQLQEREPFISELLNTLFDTIHDLQPHQVSKRCVGCDESVLAAAVGPVRNAIDTIDRIDASSIQHALPL